MGLIELTVSDTNVDEMTENPWQVDSIQIFNGCGANRNKT